MVAGHLQIRNGIYHMVLSYSDSEGRRRQRWVSTKLKVKGNKRRALEMLMELRRNFVIPSTISEFSEISLDMPFADYLKVWLQIRKDSLAPSTFASYYRVIYRDICPYFEKKRLRLSDVKPIHIQSFYNERIKHVSASSVRHYQIVIHAAYRYLMLLDVITNNPADRVILPKKQKYIPSYYNVEELNMLFKAARNTPLDLLIKVTACYGLRRSEVLGLKWNAIDFSGNTITIKHTVVSVNLDGQIKVIGENKAKTNSSLRTLPLLEDIKKQLLVQREKQKEYMALCGRSYNHQYDEYIFVDPQGKLYNPNYVTSNFQLLLRKNNLKHIRFHDLRHSCATLLLANSVPMKLIQEWLGHSDISTTANIYSHTDYQAKLIPAGIVNGTLILSDDTEGGIKNEI